jgi:hypothetical protein
MTKAYKNFDLMPEWKRPLARFRTVTFEISYLRIRLFFGSLVKIQDSSVVWRWATGWVIGGSISGRSWEFFSSPPCPDRL